MKARTYFIDRLRAMLSALVIVFHTAQAYGAAGGWYWREVDDLGRPFSIALTVFCAICQSFFMGMFFLLAGYFTPPSFERKRLSEFLMDRFLRLGVPLLVYGFLIGTATSAMVKSKLSVAFFPIWFSMLGRGAFNFGPLWFAEALLYFTAAYVVWRTVYPSANTDTLFIGIPVPIRWTLAAVAVGVGALVLRVWFPLGRDVAGMNIGYFSSYIFLFVLGCYAWRRRWLERVERKHARPWGIVTMLTIPILPIVAITTGVFSGAGSALSGGQRIADVVYAFWDPFVAWGIIAVLLWQFRMRFNSPSVRWERWSARAYAAYIIHPAIVVGLAMSMHLVTLPVFVKFAVVSSLSVVLSFSIGGLLRALPGAQRVL